jgi:biotin synthase-like enzyme
MTNGIRFIVQSYDIATGSVIEEELLHEDRISKVVTLKELGYLHSEQIGFLEKIEDFKIKHQMALHPLSICSTCG